MKRHLGFIIFLVFIISLFLGRLIIMKSAFLEGDYRDQFYPWSKIYSEAIKDFHFPFWSRYFHSGFPLMAEGQIGGFYPLNIIMFFLLPFKLAYNYSVILHFILAGIFTYLYTRNLGAGQNGGFLAVLTFCFGSAYAGCFYNIVTLRTLIWFPLVLLLLEKFFEGRRLGYVILSGLIAGMQFLAGFIQMAAYSWVFYMIYLLYGLRTHRIGVRRGLLSLPVFALSGVIIALPQILLSYGLTRVSGRASASLGFALWNSFPPPCLLSIFFPSWFGFFGHQLYIGAFSLLFVICAVLYSRGGLKTRPLILIGIIAVLSALGRYNPLYVALLKITGFYTFRNPSKFLFFALFAGSVLSGLGYSYFFQTKDRGLIRLTARVFSVMSALALSVFFLVKMILPSLKENITGWLKAYVFKYVLGQPYHRYDMDRYLYKIDNIYQLLVGGTELNNIFTLFSLSAVALGLLAAIFILIRPDRSRWLATPAFCLIFLEIYVYSFYGTGFRGNIKDFDYVNPTHQEILKGLDSDNGLYRIAPFGLLDADMPWWGRPNANILVGIDSIAAYTPLAESRYRDRLLTLEVVDDSLGLLSPNSEALDEKHNTLRLLNVKYIVSARRLRYGYLKELMSDEGVFLYMLKDYLPRIFFAHGIEGALRKAPVEYLRIKDYRDGLVRVEVSVEEDGFLVFSENYYPGWEAYIDDKKADIITVEDLIQAVYIRRGSHSVVFKYSPAFYAYRP